MIHENCAVVGIFSMAGDNVIPFVIDCLRALQHRGQEAWGIAIPRKSPLKRLGLVSSSANEFDNITRKYSSHAAIGHVRYSTAGKSILNNAQPIKVKDLCIAHNGTIANVDQLTSMVGGCSFTPQSMTDTLIAARHLASHLAKKNDITEALSILKKEMIGSFCFTFLTGDGSVYAARDPKGFRPLVIGFHKPSDTFIVASESCALSAVGAYLRRDVEPGEILQISEKGVRSEYFASENPHAHCAFEYTYFAHPTSIMEGVNVYAARKRIGQFLAKEFKIPGADLVIPVPDSARPAALGYALESGLPFEEGLMKNRYSRKGSMRSFIEPYHETRVEINKGIIPLADLIRGKSIVVVDDSIVRGNSSASIVKMLRDSGAWKISMIITYPPVRYPCYAGIDFPSQDELLAYQQVRDDNVGTRDIADKVAQSIGADFVAYNNTSTLAKAINIPENELCFTCTTGDYSPLGVKPLFRSRAMIKGNN
jgi:amidophosphoribosyltransferase